MGGGDGTVAGAGWRTRAKRYRLGRMAAALWRLRRAPAQAARAEIVERADQVVGRVPPPRPRLPEALTVFSLPAGPGSQEALLDTVDSITAAHAGSSGVIVVEDAAPDARESAVRAEFPEIEVQHRRFPTGGPPNLWPMLEQSMRMALERHDFQLFVKMDTDAVLCGPGFSGKILERFLDAPRAGVAGSFRVRCDGEPEDHTYHAEVLDDAAGEDPTIEAALNQARQTGWRVGDIVQGGIFCVTREACQEMLSRGWLDWERPWHSLVSEDLAISLFAVASGFELLSIGDPDGIVAVANKHLPLPKEEIADGPWVAAHSVNNGLHGESEHELRAYFRTRRAEWRED